MVKWIAPICLRCCLRLMLCWESRIGSALYNLKRSMMPSHCSVISSIGILIKPEKMVAITSSCTKSMVKFCLQHELINLSYICTPCAWNGLRQLHHFLFLWYLIFSISVWHSSVSAACSAYFSWCSLCGKGFRIQPVGHAKLCLSIWKGWFLNGIRDWWPNS